MNLLNLTKNNFEQEVLNAKETVLVDFWASWCGPCRMLSPIIHELSEEVNDDYKICKVNVDEEEDLARQYQISSIPTILIFKNGQLVEQSVGFQSKENIQKMLGIK